jgi:RNA polymerase sigma factor (sigma-70 family)
MDASAASLGPLQLRRSRAALRLSGDGRLVTLVRDGDATAFEVMYDRHAAKLLSFCRHMLGSQHDAEDAVQRVFAAAYRALLRNERSIELRPWLFAIARNECVSMLRRRRTEVELDTATLASHALSQRVEVREDLRHLLADIQNLPERQRAALLLCELGGFTHAQIAAVIGVRPEQVKAQVFQARSNLIADRDARARSCSEVREELAGARGASLLRRSLRRHLRVCRDCREYADAVAEQRQALAVLLPVAPSLALRASTLRAALGVAQTNGAAPGGVGVALANAGGKAFVVKGLAVAAIAGAGVGVSVGVGVLPAHPPHVLGTTRPDRAAAPPAGAPAVPRELAPVTAAARPAAHVRSPSVARAPGHQTSLVAGVGAAQPAARAHELVTGEGHPAAMGGVRGRAIGATRSPALQRRGSHVGPQRAPNTRAQRRHGAAGVDRQAPAAEHRSSGRSSSRAAEASPSKAARPPATGAEHADAHAEPGGAVHVGREGSRG